MVKIQAHKFMRLDISQSGIKHFIVFMIRGDLDLNILFEASSLEYDVVYSRADLRLDVECDTYEERIGSR